MLSKALACNRLLDYSLLSNYRLLDYSLLARNRLLILIAEALSVIVGRLFMVGLFVLVLVGIILGILILIPLRIWINIGLIRIGLKVVFVIWRLVI